MKSREMRALTFFADLDQVAALRRHARTVVRDGRVSVSGVIRDAIEEYLARHAGKRRASRWVDWRGGVRGRASTGKTPPRIMLHLRDAKRLELLRLHARTLKGTHRTVGRAIRAAIDEYMAAHAKEVRELLRRRRGILGDEAFRVWKRWVERGEWYEGLTAGKLHGLTLERQAARVEEAARRRGGE
jgi:hypothetical protein